jgi:hypothetical protein
MWYMGSGCRYTGSQVSFGSCQEAKAKAKQSYDSLGCGHDYGGFRAGIQAEAGHYNYPPTPPFWAVLYTSYASTMSVFLWAWYDQHPGEDPDVLIFEDDPGAWDIVGTAYPVLCGYPGDGPCALSDTAPSVYVNPGGAGSYSLPFDKDFIDPWWGGLSVRWKNFQPPYVLNPPCEPENVHYDYHNWYWGPARVYAAFQAAGYQASIPLSSLAGLSRPVAFVVSHDLPAVAPPIPLF